MSHPHRPVRLLLTAILLGVATAGQTQSPALTVNASLDKSEVVLGEPVVVYVQLADVSDAPVPIPTELDPEYRKIRYFIQSGTEPEREFLPWAIIENDVEAPLAPGTSRTVAGKIFFGARGWTFRENGSYQLRAVFRGTSSPSVTLTVSPSADAAERTWGSALVETPEAGLFLLVDGGDEQTKGAALVRQVAGSQTRLSGYANHAIGVSLSQSFVNLRTNSVRPANNTAAEQFLNRSKVLLPGDAVYYRLESERIQIGVTRSLGKIGAAGQLQQSRDKVIRDNLLLKSLPEPTKAFLQGIVKQ